MIGAISTLLYGLLSIGGGVMGYRQAGSKVSLISGSISGLLLLLAAGLMFQGNLIGLRLAQVIVGILVVVFLSRLIKTRKFMPAGLMIATGVATLITLFIPSPF